jgi:hypothetical protein
MMADQAVELKKKFEHRLITLQTNTKQCLLYMDGYSVLQDETKRIGEASNYSSQPSHKDMIEAS